MENPFSFSGVVEGLAFCNRERELSELKRLIQASQNVLLYAHRRYGKTSLIKKAFGEVKGIATVYVDIYGTTSVEEFIAAFLAGISRLEPKIDRLMKVVRSTVKSFQVQFSVDPATGLPIVAPSFPSRPRETPPIEEVFTLLQAVSTRKKIAVAFDEFQEIAAYGGATFEKRLRRSLQGHKNISYVFAGSQTHLLVEMFNDAKRAFYQQAASFPLKKIEIAEYVAWADALYRKAGREIDARLVEQVVLRCDQHPMYIQEFLFHLWQVKKPTMETIEVVERRIIESRLPQYAHAWDGLTLNQRKVLKLIVASKGEGIYSAGILNRFGFSSASQVKTAVEALVARQFMVKNRAFSIQDPIFSRWIELQPGL